MGESHVDLVEGADVADYNNDGRPDIFVLDMLAEGNRRQKLLAITPTPRFQDSPQYTRNVLQLHNGNGTFSEIGQLAGVSNTDWSWAALFADFDLDGLKDLYVTNGVPRDQTNLDFQYSRGASVQRERGRTPSDLYQLMQKIPSTPIPNYAFRNEGDLTFAKKGTEWGVAQKGFSNGAAYADLDRDGDLDLAVNNVNERAWVYRNNAAERTDRHSLRVELVGTGRNRFGIGAKVTLTTPGGETHYQEMMPARGFQSSVEPVLTFGLGEAEEVDLTVTWPDRTRQRISNVRTDRTVTLRQEEAESFEPTPDPSPNTPLSEVSPDQKGLVFSHRENEFDDYRHEPLQPHKLSRLGPALARGDVNGDGQAELVAGNRGLNGYLQARLEEPAAIYAADFARDGGTDPIVTHHLEGEAYPVYWHDTLVEAIPPFEPRFDSYEDYAASTIGDILTEEERKKATRLRASIVETSLFVEQEDGTFERRALPVEAQFAPVHGLLVRDVNGDERPDLLLAGNDFTVRPQWGRADAEKGTVLVNRGDLTFDVLRSRESGFYAPEDVRVLTLLEEGPAAPLAVVGANNASLSAFSLSTPPRQP